MRTANFKIDLKKLGVTEKQIKQYNIRSNVISIPPNQVSLFKDEQGNMFLSITGGQARNSFYQAVMQLGYQGVNVPTGPNIPQNIPLDMTPEEAYTEFKMASIGR